MYNKLFTKILDSSIWLEPTPTRIVWLTFIAAMDEDGFAAFASIANVARRAIVTVAEAEAAIKALEGPDRDSSDPENEGRRIERVPGGWMILNSEKYRAMVTKVMIQEQTRLRVKRHREKRSVTHVTLSNDPVTHSNESVTPSEAEAEALANAKSDQKQDLRIEEQADPNVVAATNSKTGDNGHAKLATTRKPINGGGSKRPVFRCERFVVFEWMLDDIAQVLGPHTNAFGLDEWFNGLGQQLTREGRTISKQDFWPWLQAQLSQEIVRRQLPTVDPAAKPKKDPEAEKARTLRIAREMGVVK